MPSIHETSLIPPVIQTASDENCLKAGMKINKYATTPEELEELRSHKPPLPGARWTKHWQKHE